MINVTEHQNCNNKKNLLIDQERYKKEKFQENRKKRIQEVRRTSKEFAKKVRQNVRKETDNQLKQIEKTKADEMISWQIKKEQERPCRIQTEPISTTWNIGDAHKAAADEIARNEEWEVQKQIALCRSGSIASRSKQSCESPNSAKLKQGATKKRSKTKSTLNNLKKNSASCNWNHIEDNYKENNEREPHCNAKPNIEHNCEESSDESRNNVLKQKNRSNTHSNNRSKQNSFGILSQDLKNIHPHRERIVNNYSNKEDDSNTSSLENFDNSHEDEYLPHSSHKRNKNSKQKQKKQKRNHQKLKKTPAVVMDIGLSDTSSSSLNIEDSHVESNQHFSRIYSKQPHYNPEDFQTNVSEPDSRISQRVSTRFTLISDLLKFQEEKLSKHLDKSVREIFKSPLEKNITESCSTKSPKCLTANSSKCPIEKIPRSSLKGKSNVSKKKIRDLSDTSIQNTINECDNFKSKDNINVVMKSSLQNKTSLINLENKLEDSSKSWSECIEPKTSKVKFYDYNNKFTKEYDPNLRVRVTSDKNFYVPETNAIENAEIENQVDQERQRELTLLKKKSEIRGQKALEREKVRRDYALLEAKLDKVTSLQQQQQQQAATSRIVNDEYLFSEVRLKKQTDQRQKKINSAVESLLNRPSIITCPEINNKDKKRLKSKTKDFSSESINLESDQESEKIDMENSESCCSILLSYAENQSSQIKQDIKSCKSSDKVEKLKMLVRRINSLKFELLEELKKCSTNDPIQNAIDLLSELKKEHEDIMVTSTEKKDLEKREKILRKKEEFLEKKVRDFLEIEKKKSVDKNCSADSQCVEISNEVKSSDPSTDSTSCILAGEPIAISSQNPLEIVIKLRDPTKKRSKLIYGKKSSYRHNISTPIMQIKRTPSPETSPTVYRSPPVTIENKLSNICDDILKPSKIPLKNQNKLGLLESQIQKDQRNCEAEKPFYNSELSTLNPQLRKYVQRLLGMSRHSINMLAVSSSTITTPSSSIINNINNRTEQNEEDFERLERLQCVINENYSFLSEIEDSVKSNKTSVEDNSNTINQKVWRKVLSTTPPQSDFCPPKTILKKTSFPDQHRQEKQTDVLAISNEKLEVFFRNYYEMNDNSRQRIAHLNDMINKIRLEKQKIMETTLSSNGAVCSESHSEYLELTQKKQVEYANGSNSTKASDSQVLDKSENQQANVNDRNRKKLQEIEDEQMNLEKNKLTGISRDSGISLSRPVTAQDHRESPSVEAKKESRGTLEAFEPLLKNIPKPCNQYSPHTENLVPKPDNQRSEKVIHSGKKGKPPSSIKRYSPQMIDEVAHELSTIFEIDTPVTSIINVPSSQQRQDQIVQQNNNLSQVKNSKLMPINEIKKNTENERNTETIRYPTFQEYVDQNKIDISQFDPEVTERLKKEFEKLHELSENIKNIKCKPVDNVLSYLSKDESNTSMSTVSCSLKQKDCIPFCTHKECLHKCYEASTTTMSTVENLSRSIIKPKDKEPFGTCKECLHKCNEESKSNTTIRTVENLSSSIIKPKDNEPFGTCKEYLHKCNEESNTTMSTVQDFSRSVKHVHHKNSCASKECIDKSSKNFSLNKIAEELLQSSSVESLFDVETELKRRNILQDPFVYKESPAKKQNNVHISSKDLLTIDSMSKEKEFAKSLAESGIEAMQSINIKSNELQKDLDHMGLNWASSMLKKSHQCKNLNNSNSSTSSSVTEKTKKKCPNKSGDFVIKSKRHYDDDTETDSSDSSSEIRDIDLRQFIAQELKRKTEVYTDSTNTSIFTESLASQFLQKYLGAAQTRPPPNQNANLLSVDRKQKTSTPVESPTSESAKKEGSSDTSSVQIFSGECRLSSVRLSSDSSHKCDKD